MNRHDEEKKAMELAAVDIFLELHNLNYKRQMELLHMQERPDAVLRDTSGGLLGMEVTHLFYDNEEARQLMGNSRQVLPGSEQLEHFVQEINRRIRIKEEKLRDYSHDYPCALLIRNVSTMYGMSDVLRKKQLLHKPGGHFTHVWLLSRDFTPDWLLKNLYEVGP
ncbi:hypothetical protein B5M42_024950 [Paenibacillus athensensis]|uniref:Uncharacterized protein n=1 Tax=Paenibacillus athensensis TaxID=1967502 RepID=A0A4Y8PQ22_9BACL|nr:hypothetical protein [Paenibacillus athensensis]MCD1262033.1 hypothetical protein [Paenibacillus athensensis]